MKRTTCSACTHDDLEIILDLGMSPIADAYTANARETSAAYPLQLAVCRGCHLVQLTDILPRDVLFGTGYSFYSSASAPLVAYHKAYAHNVLKRYHALVSQLVVEIGCNDGDMLQHFAAENCRVVGVDPAGGPVKTALNRGLNVINEPFTVEVAERVVADYGYAGVVIANHVLAHVEDVSEVMCGIAQLLATDGVAFIEVQYLPDLLLNNAFDLVYHEHRNFFTLRTIRSVARRWGLNVLNAELTDRQGGSLRVSLGHTFRQPSASTQRIMAAEYWLSTGNAYGGLQGRVERIRDRLNDMLAQCVSDQSGYGEHKVIGYGAPAKATTLLNFCGINSVTLPAVIDSTPAKQGRFIPGTGIKIIAEDKHSLTDETDTVLILSWNYAKSIMRKHHAFTQRGGRWILPVPVPMML